MAIGVIVYRLVVGAQEVGQRDVDVFAETPLHIIGKLGIDGVVYVKSVVARDRRKEAAGGEDVLRQAAIAAEGVGVDAREMRVRALLERAPVRILAPLRGCLLRIFELAIENAKRR